MDFYLLAECLKCTNSLGGGSKNTHSLSCSGSMLVLESVMVVNDSFIRPAIQLNLKLAVVGSDACFVKTKGLFCFPKRCILYVI